jgi:hypothetical protein
MEFGGADDAFAFDAFLGEGDNDGAGKSRKVDEAGMDAFFASDDDEPQKEAPKKFASQKPPLRGNKPNARRPSGLHSIFFMLGRLVRI